MFLEGPTCFESPTNFPFNPSHPILETITFFVPVSPSLTDKKCYLGEADELEEKPGVMDAIRSEVKMMMLGGEKRQM